MNSVGGDGADSKEMTVGEMAPSRRWVPGDNGEVISSLRGECDRVLNRVAESVDRS